MFCLSLNQSNEKQTYKEVFSVYSQNGGLVEKQELNNIMWNICVYNGETLQASFDIWSTFCVLWE